jgi:putative membrane protein
LFGAFYSVAASGAVLAQTTNKVAPDRGYYHGPGMMWGGGHWGGFSMIFGSIFMLLLLGAGVAAVIYIVRSMGALGPSNMLGGPGQGSDKAISILKERFARGEIDKDEFEERRKLLE